MKQLESWEGRNSFVRSFAYAWVLLRVLADDGKRELARQVKAEDDLGALTQKFFFYRASSQS